LHTARTSAKKPSGGTMTPDSPWIDSISTAAVLGPIASRIACASPYGTVMKPGVNISAEIAFGSKWKGKFYAKARYHRMMFRNSHTDYIPVNFGYRW